MGEVGREKHKRSEGEKSLNNGQICGFPLFSSSRENLLIALNEIVEGKYKKCWIATVNPEFFMAAQKDEKFAKILKEKTTVNVADGIGLVWARKVALRSGLRKWMMALTAGINILFGGYREEVITGADLMDDLSKIAAERGLGVYFFGGWGDRAKRTAEFFSKKYLGLKVTGYKDENFDFKVKTDILFVARGMKKQEEWIEEHFDRLNVRLVMGVGRSFDYYSGDLKRAPKWMRRMGLEWLYSLYKEPKRWRRQLALPKFVWEVLIVEN